MVGDGTKLHFQVKPKRFRIMIVIIKRGERNLTAINTGASIPLSMDYTIEVHNFSQKINEK